MEPLFISPALRRASVKQPVVLPPTNGRSVKCRPRRVEQRHVDAFGQNIAPFFELYAQSSHELLWPWEDPSRTRATLDACWAMLERNMAVRKWLDTRELFDAQLPDLIAALARILNGYRLWRLRDVGYLPPKGLQEVLSVLYAALHAVSRTKVTRDTRTRIGSIILHHYFPSVVPIFDPVFFHENLQKTTAYSIFRDSALTMVWSSFVSLERELRDYHAYFAFFVDTMLRTHMARFNQVCLSFAHGLSAWVPQTLREDPTSYVWFLDAKVLESCLLDGADRIFVWNNERRKKKSLP